MNIGPGTRLTFGWFSFSFPAKNSFHEVYLYCFLFSSLSRWIHSQYILNFTVTCWSVETRNPTPSSWSVSLALWASCSSICWFWLLEFGPDERKRPGMIRRRRLCWPDVPLDFSLEFSQWQVSLFVFIQIASAAKCCLSSQFVEEKSMPLKRFTSYCLWSQLRCECVRNRSRATFVQEIALCDQFQSILFVQNIAQHSGTFNAGHWSS